MIQCSINHMLSFTKPPPLDLSFVFPHQGYGFSRPPDRIFPSAEEFFSEDADDAVALMKHLGHESFSLLGWSDGGITAMFIAGARRCG